MATPVLPVGYHVTNFSTLLETVMAQYGDLLTQDEHAMFAGFQQLSQAGKSLYCRLLTRRGDVLRLDKLNYADVPNLSATVEELATHRLASINSDIDPEHLLALLTRQELNQHFPLAGQSRFSKSDLISQILGHWETSTLLSLLRQHFPYVQPHYQEAFTTFLLCFFGNSHQDLTEFVVNDLGHVRYETYSLCRETRFFECREQIEQQKRYGEARQRLDDKGLMQDSAELINLANSLPLPDEHPHLQRRYQKLILEIARQLERLEQLEPALALYQSCQRHPARERRVRILHKRGDVQAAYKLCQAIQENGQHPEELEFVRKFLPRLEKALAGPGARAPRQRKTAFTEFHLNLEHTGEAVELLAAEALSDQESVCCYVENTLFNGLFGLFFWDIIFAPIRGAFINPFQRGPLDLASEDFYPRRRQAIDERLKLLQGDTWQSLVLRHFENKQGLANPFVFWDGLPIELLEVALDRVPPSHLTTLFTRMLQHPGLFRNGFPDLIRFQADHYELIEVKAPGDKLQANQIRWFEAFQQASIPARVCWVQWCR